MRNISSLSFGEKEMCNPDSILHSMRTVCECF